METFSALLAICAGNSPVPGEFSTQRPVTRSFDVYFDLRPDKRLSKQLWGWWFETLSHSLWRHRNETLIYHKWIRLMVRLWRYTKVCILSIEVSWYPEISLVVMKNIVFLAETFWHIFCQRYYEENAQRAHDVMITSLLHQNDVATSFWRKKWRYHYVACPLGGSMLVISSVSQDARISAGTKMTLGIRVRQWDGQYDMNIIPHPTHISTPTPTPPHPEARTPVLPDRSNAVPSLVTNGSVAFKQRLHFHWLKRLAIVFWSP